MIKRLLHKLFFCPTFWTWRPAYRCSSCGTGFRCYQDGHDCKCGAVDLCRHCIGYHPEHFRRLFNPPPVWDRLTVEYVGEVKGGPIRHLEVTDTAVVAITDTSIATFP